MNSRQELRQRERGLRKRGEAVLKAGLPQTPVKDDMVAVAYVLARLLRDTAVPDRASRAADAVHAMCEASRKRAPGAARLACGKGCGYCCHGWVGASVPEAMLLARAIRSGKGAGESRVAGIVDRSIPLAGLNPSQRFGAKLPCPLLVDNICSQYRERPTTCRQATSLDLSKCVEEFEGQGEGGEIPVSAVYLAHARNARVPLLAALRMAGLETHTYELSAAVSRLLVEPDAEMRWLGGADVLVGIARGPREPAAVEHAVSVIASEVGGLVAAAD